MIHSVEFKEDWRCFKVGDSFDFRPGVNLLVGDQGCGKSSLFAILRDAAKNGDKSLKKKARVHCDKSQLFSFDFEHENPRTVGYFLDDTLSQVAAMFSSHGECNRAVFAATRTASDCVLLMDEPDMALSIRSCKMLVLQLKALVQRNSQVIIAVHNITMIQAFDEVLSLEHRKWMPSAEFIASHLACVYCGCHPCGCGG
ncbi:hypothetical protein LCGC14_2861010 [marine sediment metagenome]|uniref:AAA+ ATPase domain-containing protein n=1 Tax=marine sediment metagenome TaxID=412755 RepID=A0A0F8Y5W6_9ZZZZ